MFGGSIQPTHTVAIDPRIAQLSQELDGRAQRLLDRSADRAGRDVRPQQPVLPARQGAVVRVGQVPADRAALPGLFHRLFDPNQGWSATEQGGAAQAFYHLGDGASSFFAGGYLRFERWTWRRAELPGEATGSQLFVMPAAGLRWAPWGRGLFVAPWLGLGVSVWDSGPGLVGPHEYEPLRWFPIAAIHVGYET